MRKNVNVSIFAVLSFILLWVITASFMLNLWPSIHSASKWKAITHEEYNFTIEYPAKWRVQKYGDSGCKGEREVKLLLYPNWMSNTYVEVLVKSMDEPTLSDVVNWSEDRLRLYRYNATIRGDNSFRESALLEMVLHGQPVIQRKYELMSNSYEEVYIARSSDMIIIRLQSPCDEFPAKEEIFHKIVESFRPLK